MVRSASASLDGDLRSSPTPFPLSFDPAQCEHKDLICIYPSSLHSAAARHAQLPPRPNSTPGSGPSSYDPPRVTFHDGGTSSSLPSVLPEVDFVSYPLYSPSLSYEHNRRDGSSSSSSSTGSGSSVGSPQTNNMPIHHLPHPTGSYPYPNMMPNQHHQPPFHPDLFPPSTSTSSVSASSSAFPPSFLFHPHPSAPNQPSTYPPSNGSRPGSYAYLDETLPWGSSVTGDLAVAWGLQNQQRGGCGVLPPAGASHPMPMGGEWNMWGPTSHHAGPTTESGGWGTVERVGAQPQSQPQPQQRKPTSTSPTRSSYASDISQYTQSLLLTHPHPTRPHLHTQPDHPSRRPGGPAHPYPPPPQHATPAGQQAQLEALFATWAGPETVGGGGGEGREERERDRGEKQGRGRGEAEVQGWA